MRSWLVVLAVGAMSCDLLPKPTDDRVDDILAMTGDPVNGQTVYTTNCAECHRASGLGVDDPIEPGTGQNLTDASGEFEEDPEFVQIILEGKEEMPAFTGLLTDQEIADVLSYIHDGLIQPVPVR